MLPSKVEISASGKKILSIFLFLNSCCAEHNVCPKAAVSRKPIRTSKAWKDWHVHKTWQTHGKEENRKSRLTPAVQRMLITFLMGHSQHKRANTAPSNFRCRRLRANQTFFPKRSPRCKIYCFFSKIMVQGARSPPWGLAWLIGREQPVTSTAFQELEINYPDKKWTSNTQTTQLMMLKVMEDKGCCTEPGRSICSCILTGECAQSPASPCSAAAGAPGCRWTAEAAGRGKPDQGWANISFHWSF